MTLWRISERVKPQFDRFMSGLHEVVSHELLNLFDVSELELLISGIAEIDLDDWQRFTDHRNCTKDDQVVAWFWQFVREADGVTRAKLLQFVTGTSRIPGNGFRDLQGSDGPRHFTIEMAGRPDQLPKAHTWCAPTACVLDSLPVALIALICHLTHRTKHYTPNCSTRYTRPSATARSDPRLCGPRHPTFCL